MRAGVCRRAGHLRRGPQGISLLRPPSPPPPPPPSNFSSSLHTSDHTYTPHLSISRPPAMCTSNLHPHPTRPCPRSSIDPSLAIRAPPPSFLASFTSTFPNPSRPTSWFAQARLLTEAKDGEGTAENRHLMKVNLLQAYTRSTQLAVNAGVALYNSSIGLFATPKKYREKHQLIEISATIKQLCVLLGHQVPSARPAPSECRRWPTRTPPPPFTTYTATITNSTTFAANITITTAANCTCTITNIGVCTRLGGGRNPAGGNGNP